MIHGQGSDMPVFTAEYAIFVFKSQALVFEAYPRDKSDVIEGIQTHAILEHVELHHE